TDGGRVVSFSHRTLPPVVPAPQLSRRDRTCRVGGRRFRILRLEVFHGSPQRHRLCLDPRVDVEINRPLHCLLDTWTDHYHPVSAHECDWPVAERGDERGGNPAIIHDIRACPFDLANLECRHTAYKKSGGKVDGAKRCARNRESENGWSVRVNDRVHIGAGLVDLAMDEAFLVQLSIL